MLPRPAIRRWSSSALLSGAREPANSFARRRASKSGASGSSPSPISLGWVLECLARNEVEKTEAPRIVVGDDLAVIEMHARRGRASGPWSVHDGTRRVVVSAASTRNEPDIPRWPISVSPSSSRKKRYLARRASATIRRPSGARGIGAGRESGCPSAAIRPFRCALRPWPARGRAGRSRPPATQASAWPRITARNAAPYFCSLSAPTP